MKETRFIKIINKSKPFMTVTQSGMKKHQREYLRTDNSGNEAAVDTRQRV